MFPLKQRVISGYRFKQKTSYSSAHLGVDYRANYVELYAPFNGSVEQHDGPQGGITLWFWPDNGVCKVMRFMHLSEVRRTGRVSEGDLIAITGASGSLAGSPHLHLDCSNSDNGTFWGNINNFIDPESITWEGDNMTYDLFGTPDGTVYERLNNYALVHIPDPEFAVRYYGANWHDKVKIVDDIWSVGWIAEDPRPLKNRISELENRPPVEKIVEKPVDRPETLEELAVLKRVDAATVAELEKSRESLVEANKAISTLTEQKKQLEVEIESVTNTKDDLILQKSDWLKEMADYDKKYYLIPRDILQKMLSTIVNIFKKK